MIYNLYRMFTKTRKNEKYWKNRKIDWKTAYWTPEHPHRDLIIEGLKRFNFGSVYEIGCGAGANLYRIHQAFPHTQFGGMDINTEAIMFAKQALPLAQILDVGVADNIFFSDKSIDVVLTDAAIIYIGKDKIDKVMKEISRIARNGVVLCEFHSKSRLKRLGLRWGSHFSAYDYEKLLTKYGFYDVKVKKIPKESWPILPWEKFGYIITARI